MKFNSKQLKKFMDRRCPEWVCQGDDLYTYEIPEDNSFLNELIDDRTVDLFFDSKKRYISIVSHWENGLKFRPEDEDALVTILESLELPVKRNSAS